MNIFDMVLDCFKAQDESKRTSNELEKRLHDWMEQYDKAIKILLLGAGASGKTTIIKQMKILHIQGFSESERMEKVKDIRANILEAIVAITRQMLLCNIPLHNETNRPSFQFISNIDLNQDFEYSIEFFDHVKNLWNDQGLKECYETTVEFDLPDCSKYFLDQVSQVGSPDYVPTDQDILYCRRTTTEIQKIEFQMKIPKKYGGGNQNFWMFDVGGQRGERRKWIQVFDGINTILFLVACNVFDQTDPEDPTMNRLQESIKLFQDVWRSRFLLNSGFIVFFNKQDLLKTKVESGVSIREYFPEYYNYQITPEKRRESGAAVIEDEYLKTRAFIKDLFLMAKDTAPPPTPRIIGNIEQGYLTMETVIVKTKRDCYWHYTVATNTTNIQHVMEDVHHMIIKSNLEILGLT